MYSRILSASIRILIPTKRIDQYVLEEKETHQMHLKKGSTIRLCHKMLWFFCLVYDLLGLKSMILFEEIFNF